MTVVVEVSFVTFNSPVRIDAIERYRLKDYGLIYVRTRLEDSTDYRAVGFQTIKQLRKMLGFDPLPDIHDGVRKFYLYNQHFV